MSGGNRATPSSLILPHYVTRNFVRNGSRGPRVDAKLFPGSIEKYLQHRANKLFLMEFSASSPEGDERTDTSANLPNILSPSRALYRAERLIFPLADNASLAPRHRSWEMRGKGDSREVNPPLRFAEHKSRVIVAELAREPPGEEITRHEKANGSFSLVEKNRAGRRRKGDRDARKSGKTGG